jgi:transcriptional regulator with XRE-family HTH domain
MCIQPDPLGGSYRAPGRVRRKRYEPINPAVWERPDMRSALAVRDVAAVFRLLQKHGLSQRQIAALTGQSQSEISEILGGRKVVSYDLLVRIAEGLGVGRGLLGLAFDPSVAVRPGDVEDQAVELEPAAAVVQAREVVATWTGVESRALREAMRLSVREFASRLGVSDRMVSKWEAGRSAVRPRPFTQGLLDTALALADNEVRARFRAILAARDVAEPGQQLLDEHDD